MGRCMMHATNSGRMSHRSLRGRSRPSPAWALLLRVLACLAPTWVGADDSAPAAAAVDSGQLQEIVVTSTRREENLSKVPISVTALTQDDMDTKGIKDIVDVVRFTPGIAIDNSGTNNIAIRGISSTGGAGTTGIYIDDTPIQIRGLAFSPDDALPRRSDMDRVEVRRGPQATLFGAGSEGGTVRYITTAPSLNNTSIYARSELSFTQGGDPSYEAGVAAGGPVIDGVLGARATVWYRRDGGWIDRVDPTAADPQSAVVDHNANYGETLLVRLAALWKASDQWTVTPSIYYQNRELHDISNYWPIYSNPGSDSYENGDPTAHSTPDKFYLPALKIEGDFDAFRLISNSNTEAAGFVPFLPGVTWPLLDGSGIHLPASIANYLSPATINNNQQNVTQEVRLLSNDRNAKFVWTTGIFFSSDRQTYLEQIHDPMLNSFWEAVAGVPYTDVFTDTSGNPVPYVAPFTNDSYFLNIHARDQQLAWFGEGTYAITDTLKATVGLRESHTEYSFNTLTGGPQLFQAPAANSGDKKENSFTPKVNLSYQMDPNNLYYATYAKGFRPGGANNPVPQAACAPDFASFGITQSPPTFGSDTVNSFEVGAKNNIDNRVKIASSIYYIRWNNIQQSVLPPTCQVTFIANLGTAVAKGGDIQAEIALTDNFTAEIATGYTSARYTQDSRFSDVQALPIVSKGDAIVGQSGEPPGQPGAPFTFTLGLQYKFNVFDLPSFVRIDDEYTSRNKWPSAAQDPNTLQFNASFYPLSSTNLASARAGMNFGNWQAAAFVDNLTDTHTVNNYNFTIYPGNAPSLERQYTFRPRTVGITITYRN